MSARPILDSKAIRATERSAIESGISVETLMERAGEALAEAALRFAGPRPALVLCGPGNNGGDGYVAARHLAARGIEVRVAAIAEPKSKAAQWARSRFEGEVERLSEQTGPASILIDALFGIGLKKPIEMAVSEHLFRLAAQSSVGIACDLPSGVDSDTGQVLNQVPEFGLTVAFGALKPAHRLMPAMALCGRVAVAGIGLDASGDWYEIGPPTLPPIDVAANKYSRGLVSVLTGHMPGAAALASSAAARSGAGAVRLYARDMVANVPAALIQGKEWRIEDQEKATLLIGPGLGRDDRARRLLEQILESGRPLVIDADALRLVTPDRISKLEGERPILTPHSGEFEHLFGKSAGSKAEQALQAARRSNCVVVYKGPDTLVADPAGRLGFAPPAPSWLASAGAGDVLAGIIAAMVARGMPPFEAACAGVWLHGRAAEAAGPYMIADDLVSAIPAALALP
jgi:hydroxyethylthiazole kinase-like uncharacterized protein yjeF